MSEKPLDKFGENVLQQREQRRRRPYFTIPGETLLSDAMKEVADTSAVLVYIQIVVRQPYPPNAKEIARLKKARLWPPKPVEFSLPQREAIYHGLGVKTWETGKRELHRVGIIDIAHHGSALRGDFSRFILSERWKLWGKPGFDARPWPKAKFVPDRDKRGTGRFIGHSRKEGAKKLLEANVTSIDPSIEAGNASIAPLIEAPKAANTPLRGDFLEARKAVYIDLCQGSEVEPKVQDSEGRCKKKVFAPETRSKSTAAAIRRDAADSSHPITDDPKTLADLAASLSFIVGHLPDEVVAKKMAGRPRRNLDPNMAPRLDPGYDPDLGPWAEDESIAASIGRGGTVHWSPRCATP